MSILRVHLLGEPEAKFLTLLRTALAPEIRLTCGGKFPSKPDFDILVSGSPQPKQISASSNLRTLIIPWAGLAPQTREVMLQWPRIAVHNLHHNAGPAAELATALLLAAAKFIVPMDRALRQQDWTPRYEPNPSVLLAGKRALVLGYGAIGQRIARICRAMDMSVAAVRRRPERTPANCPDSVHPPSELPTLLPHATALIVTLPLTERTRGFIGEQELNLLPPDSVVVNVGRGPIIDEDALYKKLRTGRIRAAGLDVWYNYPREEKQRRATPPSAHPFHELDNIVMSPHRGGALNAEESEEMRMQALAELLNAAAAGRAIPHLVDVQEGY